MSPSFPPTLVSPHTSRWLRSLGFFSRIVASGPPPAAASIAAIESSKS